MHPYAPLQYIDTLVHTLSYPYTYTHYSPTGLTITLLELSFNGPVVLWDFKVFDITLSGLLFNGPVVLWDFKVFTITLSRLLFNGPVSPGYVSISAQSPTGHTI